MSSLFTPFGTIYAFKKRCITVPLRLTLIPYFAKYVLISSKNSRMNFIVTYCIGLILICGC